MNDHYLSSLCRGIGYKGRAYEDNRQRFPEKIPYTLRDVGIFDGNNEPFNKVPIPGTYLTETGQLMLYTRVNKTIDISKRTSLLLSNVADVYNAVNSVTDELRQQNIKCERLKRNIGDPYSAFSSVYANWFYPQKWKSSAKELIPKEVFLEKNILPNFLRRKSNKNSINLQNDISNETQEARNNSSCSVVDQEIIYNKINFLPDINEINSLVKTQMQNNAAELTPRSEDDETKLFSPCFSSSSTEDWQFSVTKEDAAEVSKENEGKERISIKSPIVDPTDIYDAEEELFIPVNTNKEFQKKQYSIFQNLVNSSMWKLSLSDALGEEFLSNDKKLMTKPIKFIQPARLTTRMKNTEEKRINLLNELYRHLKLISNINKSILIFAEILLDQFQEHNWQIRKRRIEMKQEDVYNKLKKLKNQDNEISQRLKNASTNILQKKKSTLDDKSFYKEQESLKYDLKYKSCWESGRLKDRLLRIIRQEEESFKNSENKILRLEHDAIKQSFRTLQDELINSNERRQETENLILRLEMRREPVSKIEKDIANCTPLTVDLDELNLTNFIKDMNAVVVVNWKQLMSEYANEFRIDDKCFYDMMVSISAIERSLEDVKENQTSEGITEKITDKETAFVKGDSSNEIKSAASINISENFDNRINTDQASSSTKTAMIKSDFENLKLSQRISSNHSFSYMVPWPKESFERYRKSSKIALSSSDDELDDPVNRKKGKRRVKQKEVTNCPQNHLEVPCKLNYKHILRYNPLKHKKKRKNQNKSLKNGLSNN